MERLDKTLPLRSEAIVSYKPVAPAVYLSYLLHQVAQKEDEDRSMDELRSGLHELAYCPISRLGDVKVIRMLHVGTHMTIVTDS